MNKILKSARKVYIHFANIAANLLPDAPGSFQLRAFIFNSMGNHIPYSAKICSGSRVLGGGLTIMDGTFVNKNCYFDLTAPIHIGKKVQIGHGCTFITAKHSLGSENERCGPPVGHGISICDGVWVHANVTIQPGVTIHRGASVMTGSVVTKDVPANAEVAGVPARIIRFLDVQSTGLDSASVSPITKSPRFPVLQPALQPPV